MEGSAGPWTWGQAGLESLASWAWGVQSPELGVQGLRLEDMRRLGLGCCRACAPGLGDRPDAAGVGCGALGWETDWSGA